MIKIKQIFNELLNGKECDCGDIIDKIKRELENDVLYEKEVSELVLCMQNIVRL